MTGADLEIGEWDLASRGRWTRCIDCVQRSLDTFRLMETGVFLDDLLQCMGRTDLSIPREVQ